MSARIHSSLSDGRLSVATMEQSAQPPMQGLPGSNHSSIPPEFWNTLEAPYPDPDDQLQQPQQPPLQHHDLAPNQTPLGIDWDHPVFQQQQRDLAPATGPEPWHLFLPQSVLAANKSFTTTFASRLWSSPPISRFSLPIPARPYQFRFPTIERLRIFGLPSVLLPTKLLPAATTAFGHLPRTTHTAETAAPTAATTTTINLPISTAARLLLRDDGKLMMYAL